MSEINEKKEPLNKNNKVPKHRFPEYNDDWICGKLNDALVPSKLRNKENKYTYLDVLSVSREKGCVNQIEYLGRSYAGSDVSNYHILKKDEVVYTKSPLAVNPYGIIQCNRYFDGIVSTMYAVYSVKTNHYPIFVDKYFQSDIRLNNYLHPLVNKGAKNDMKINNEETLKGNYFYPSLNEQVKISNFFDVLDKKIETLTSKILVLKKYKKGLEHYAYKYVKKYGVTFIFNDLFSPKNERNILSLKQYTVGKYGIKEMDEGKYDISKHKVFSPTNLIVGIGIEEIGISESIKGSVSPIYDVFTISNNSYYDSIRLTLKKQLWNKRNFITKKSTRREYEVDKKALLKMKIFGCENNSLNSISNSIDLNQKTVELLERKLNSLIDVKKYLLDNMFI